MMKQTMTAFLLLAGLNAFASETDTFRGMEELYSASKNPSPSYFDKERIAGCKEIYENGDRKISTFEFTKKDDGVTARENLALGNTYQFASNMWKTSLIASGTRNDAKFKLHLRETPDGGIIIKMTGAWEHPIGFISCTVI